MSLYAKNDSMPGNPIVIVVSFMRGVGASALSVSTPNTVSSMLRPPRFNPSMAANFIGCVLAMSCALVSPVKMVARILKIPKTEASRMLRLAISNCFFFRINQVLTPMTKQAERV